MMMSYFSLDEFLQQGRECHSGGLAQSGLIHGGKK